MARRTRASLPAGWFSDATIVLQALLEGPGTAWASIYNLLQVCIAQCRIVTASGVFLDVIGVDYFGSALPRRVDENDNLFRERVLKEILRPRATRNAIALALTQLTARSPNIFEPARTADTGGYTYGGLGYATAGGWGNLNLPYQFFVTVFRPAGVGIASFAGYGTGGIPVYASLSMQPNRVSDANLLGAIPPLLPAGITAWARISD